MIYPDMTAASKFLLERGERILQGNRFADTDEEHLTKLSEYMGLNGEREVADMGCGFGEVSRFLSNDFPQATFHLINTNEFQLDNCPVRLGTFHRYPDDMCHTMFPNGTMDLVMFNYSLCHVDPCKALTEAYRITASNGKLFIYDYERTGGDNALTEKHLYSRFMTDEQLRKVAGDIGWYDIETIYPGGDDTFFRSLMNNDALYDSMFKDLIPVIWKARR